MQNAQEGGLTGRDLDATAYGDMTDQENLNFRFMYQAQENSSQVDDGGPSLSTESAVVSSKIFCHRLKYRPTGTETNSICSIQTLEMETMCTR